MPLCIFSPYFIAWWNCTECRYLFLIKHRNYILICYKKFMGEKFGKYLLPSCCILLQVVFFTENTVYTSSYDYLYNSTVAKLLTLQSQK
jgi:hypothetical protein